MFLFSLFRNLNIPLLSNKEKKGKKRCNCGWQKLKVVRVSSICSRFPTLAGLSYIPSMKFISLYIDRPMTFSFDLYKNDSTLLTQVSQGSDSQTTRLSTSHPVYATNITTVTWWDARGEKKMNSLRTLLWQLAWAKKWCSFAPSREP